MHRSGTSVISQWLQKCGLHIGNDLLGPAAGNEDGHFEDHDFVRVHEEILKQFFLPHSGLTPLALPTLQEDQKEKIKQLVENKQLQHIEWGWKDPRTCLFLSTYRQIIPSAFYLVIVRDPFATVSSLINRRYLWLKHKNSKSLYRRWLWKKNKNKIKEELYSKYSEYYLKVWIEYNSRIIDHIKETSENSYLVVSYDSLHKSDKDLILHLSNNWGFHLSYIDFNSIFKDQLLTLPVDIEPYVIEKQLIDKANQIYLYLKEKDEMASNGTQGISTFSVH